MSRQIDEIDRQIINCLVDDGRTTGQEIARRFDLSERTVRNRLGRLLGDGVITIHATVNWPLVGYDVIADIFCVVETSRATEIAGQIAKFPEVGYVACSLGEQDISVQGYFRSNQELYEFVERKLARIPGILRTRTVVVPWVTKWKWNLPPEAVREPDFA